MALQMVDAMAPFAGSGLINMSALAAHVLQFGFGVKNPDQFIQQAPPQMPPQAAPAGMQPAGMGMEPPALPMGGPSTAPPPTSPEALSGIDPSVLAALSQRMGMDLPNSM